MSAVLVNGQTTQTGCYVDGHWGWRGTARAISTAHELGYVMTQDDHDLVARWVNDETMTDDDDSLTDAVLAIADESETWLNDHTADGFVWHWHDGEFFLSPMCEDGDCQDETCAHWD